MRGIKRGDNQTNGQAKFPTRKNFRWIVGGCILAGIVVGVGIFFLIQCLSDPTDPTASATMYDYVRTTVAILGVVTVGGAAAIQYHKQQYAEASAELERDTRFSALLTTAIEHLGHQSLTIQRGALYELRRLAIDSEKDRESVIEIIARFNREISEKKVSEEEKKSELESLLHVSKEILCSLLCRLKVEVKNINFSRTDLSDGNLAGAHLEGVSLAGAHLIKANLEGVNLKGARLDRANLEGADLERAHLEGAWLIGANLKRVNLEGAHLEGTHLELADLERVRLVGANLEGAHLQGAILRGTNLEGADITAKQLRRAYIDEYTTIDDHVREDR